MFGFFKYFSDLSPFENETNFSLTPSYQRFANLVHAIYEEDQKIKMLNNDYQTTSTINAFENLGNVLPKNNTTNNNNPVMLEEKTSLNFGIRIPSTFQGYEVIKFIGKGSFSVIALVRLKDTQKLFSAKIYSIKEMEKIHEIDSIISEALLLQSLNHPNIIKYYDSFSIFDDQNNEYFSIITEFYEGELAQYIQSGKIKKLSIKKIFYGISKAIHYLHHNRISHCDIKPDNILLDSEFNPILCDFGFSTEEKYTTNVRCTYKYAAPEIVNLKKPFNPMYADIWSLGVTFYTIIMQRFPYDYKKGFNMELLNRKISLVKNQKIQNLIRKCLQIDPNERPTINEILNDECFV